MPTQATSLRLFVPGVPRPKGSKDQFGRESSRHLRGWMDAIILVARAEARGQTLNPPYRVRFEFIFPAPAKSTYEWPSKSDLDKLCRGVNDALQAARVIADDRHIIESSEVKRYAEPGEKPGVVIEIA